MTDMYGMSFNAELENDDVRIFKKPPLRQSAIQGMNEPHVIFDEGSHRSDETGKGRFDLIEPAMLTRLAKHYENGATKYADRNWEKGQPCSRMISAALRHINKYVAGETDEDHLAAAIWNLAAVMRFEEYDEKYRKYLDMPIHRKGE